MDSSVILARWVDLSNPAGRGFWKLGNWSADQDAILARSWDIGKGLGTGSGQVLDIGGVESRGTCQVSIGCWAQGLGFCRGVKEEKVTLPR